jgi:hypothetical protein
MLFGGTTLLRCILAFSVTIPFLCFIPAYAATSGVILRAVSGVILRAVIHHSGAITVVAVNEETGLRSTVISDSKGFYSFPALDVCIYTVTATASEFKMFREDNILTDANSSVRFGVKLAVGSAATIEQLWRFG